MEICLYYNAYGEAGRDTDPAYGDGEYYFKMTPEFGERYTVTGFETLDQAIEELELESEKYSITL
jgi:hypothetical protein